jgi:sugar phosphate isomerase/epimerase
MLRHTALLGCATLFGAPLCQTVSAQTDSGEANKKYPTLLGWKIGPQIYSFRLFPFDEAIKKVKACGVASFELFSGQKLSKDINVAVGPDLLKPENKDAFKRFRDLLAENGVAPHSMGVCPGNRQHFDFAAAIGLPVLNCEPDFNQLADVDKLANEYRINVGLHNHPKPSRYWDPQIVLEHFNGLSKRIGACCDTGHWVRSGLDPLECVQKLKGRIISFHIKDLDPAKKGEKGNYPNGDTPLGKGNCKIAEILKECAEQHVQGPFSIEYESDWDKNQPLIAEGIKFFREAAKSIVQEHSQNHRGSQKTRRTTRPGTILRRLQNRLG